MTFNNGPICYLGRCYYGLAPADEGQVYVRSEYEPCVFDPNSALTHEFLHAAFYFATGDEDDTHTSPNWHKVGGITAELAQQWCH